MKTECSGNRMGFQTIAAVAAVTIILTGCDFNVTNPGPVRDEFLDQPEALQALVNGAGRQLNDAIAAAESSLGFDGATISRELHPGGQTGSFGTSVQVSRGFLTPDDTDGEVNEAYQARSLARTAVERIRDEVDDFSNFEPAATGLLWVGYSNRLLGEHVCRAVFDGGEPQSFMVHFERAEDAFTEALQIARNVGNSEVESAALAGRASVRTWLGDWSGAVQDASNVPDGFAFQAEYNNLERSQANSFYFSQSINPFATVTYWHTFYAENFEEFDDPRTEYLTYPEEQPFTQGAMWDLGDGRGELGQVPFYQQQKYTGEDSPIDLSDSREMQLIVAEGQLRDGDWQAALEIVNSIRREVGVEERSAAGMEEAWTWLKVEKAIELWLEGRWLGERRRWLGDGTDGPAPGEVPELLRMDDRPGQDRCFPISQTERDRNPNVS